MIGFEKLMGWCETNVGTLQPNTSEISDGDFAFLLSVACFTIAKDDLGFYLCHYDGNSGVNEIMQDERYSGDKNTIQSLIISRLEPYLADVCDLEDKYAKSELEAKYLSFAGVDLLGELRV